MPKPKTSLQEFFYGTLRRQMQRVFFAVLARLVRQARLTPVFYCTRGRIARVAGVIAGMALLVSLGFGLARPMTSTAATSSNLNFQARLQSNAGAIVPDGNYNLEFKLYNASSGGTALWTEDYLNSASHGAQVINGYLSVNLGSITAFPTNINWDQDMYVTMNVGGTTTGTPGWDGEMNPRLKLTAVPYAFQSKSAEQLQKAANGHVTTLSFATPSADNSITLPDASGTVCLQNSTACGFALAGDVSSGIQNGTSLQGGANINISSGSTSTTTMALQSLASQTANLLETRDQGGTVMTSIGSNGALTVGSNSTTAFKVQNSSGQALFNVDTSAKIVTVGNLSDADIQPWKTVNSLPVATAETAQVYYNGYVYVMGGFNNSGTGKSNIFYAKVNSDGSLGSWQCQGQNASSGAADYCGGATATSSTVLPSGIASSAAVAYNGYMYIFGGYNGSYLNTVYSAPINANGTLGTWTSQGSIPQTEYATAAAMYNGYVYLVGGKPSAPTSATKNLQFAKLGSGGQVGTWTNYTTALPNTLASGQATVWGGYLYALGGNNENGPNPNLYYMKLNSDGTPSTTTFTTNATPIHQAQDGGSIFAQNGYLYSVGSLSANTSLGINMEYASINSDGSVNAFTDSAQNLPEQHSHFGLSGVNANGYFYVIGGYAGTSFSALSSAYVTSTQRIKVSGNLDIQGYTNFAQGASISGSLTIDSGVAGDSGLSLKQLDPSAPTDSSYTGILGIDADGHVGLVGIDTVSSQLMDYWGDLAWDTTHDRLGIGNTAPDYKLDVKDSVTGGYVARIQNTSTATATGDSSNSANGLLIQLGTDNASRTTGNYFIGFAGGTSGAGTIAGKIQGGASGVAYTTSGADYAEYFKANPADLPQTGEIVSLDPSTAQGVVRSGGSTAPFGIISANPGFLGNGPICSLDDNDCDKNYARDNVIVGLNGQLPTKVSVANGAINIGDPIMASSSQPGVGVKATGYSRIIGYAEEAASADGVIKVLVQPGIFDPVAATNLQGSGNPLTIDSDLHVTGNTVLEGTLNVGKALNAPSISVVTANVSGDLTVVGTVTTGNLNVLGSATIQTLTINGVATFAQDIKLGAAVNTRQATLKSFKASKPITAGSVVVLDNRDGHEGEITTTTSVNDSRVIGVAVTDAANEGDTVDVAVSGWVQVRVDTTKDSGGHSPEPLKAGQLISTSIGEGTIQTPSAPSTGSVLGKTTSKQDSNNLVWIMITLQ